MSLSDNLIAFWKLDEGAGNPRADSIGVNHLAEHNNVGQATGRMGDCATFDRASSQNLSLDDNVDLSTGDIDFTFVLWLWLDDPTVQIQGVLSKWNNAPGQGEYLLYYNHTGLAADRLAWGVDSGAAQTWVYADQVGALAANTWYFIVLWHDSATDEIGIQVNDGTPDTAAHTGGVLDGNNTFLLGVDPAGFYLGGRLDAAGFWKRLLTTEERPALYNGANGLEPPFDETTTCLRFRRTRGGALYVPDSELVW